MLSMLENQNILLGVTGGIAAYKTVTVASQLTQRNACVKTVMTDSATRLVTPLSFQAVTGQPVFTGLWQTQSGSSMGHIDLAQWADKIVIAPATADFIAKVVHGLCDDLLSTLLCTGWEKPRLFAPAMNTQMWNNPVVQHHLKALAEMGIHTVGPTEGRLACGTEGLGRMAEPDQIIAAIETL